MKTKRLTALILTLVLTLGILPFAMSAATRPVTTTSTASITVENALPNDQLSAYKVVDIAYNSANNTLTYSWNSAFADFFEGNTSYNSTAYTVDDFAKLTDDSADLKDLLSQLPKYIADRSIDAVKTAVVSEAGIAVFSDLAMGEYFIRPTSTTSVYQLMLQKIEPKVEKIDGKDTYVIDDVTFTAKKEEVNITKKADKTSVTKNEKVVYTITVDIPTYSDKATDKSFSVYDILPDGLTINVPSITVKRAGTDITDKAGTEFTLDGKNTAAEPYYTFKISIDTDQYAPYWSAFGGQKLVITYTATLNDDDTTEVNVAETNTATFDYSFYPYVNNSHHQKTATVSVTTFAIKINKFVDGKPDTKLADAKFDLYRTATQEEIDKGVAIDIPHTDIKGIKLEGDKITNTEGVTVFEKYEANAAKYDYYLVETSAPAGYNILDKAVKVNFTDDEVANTEGIFTVNVSNSSGIKLPVTGGTGTVIFTVIGIVLMAGAVLLFVFARKKNGAK